MGFPKRLAGGLEMDAEHLEAAVNKIIRRRHPDVACQLTLTLPEELSLRVRRLTSGRFEVRRRGAAPCGDAR